MYAWYYGMDLPTNAQWDWAASGSHDVVEYPSGIVPKCHENSVCETDRPEAHFGGDVVEPEGLPGVVHMHDNVSEWVRDWQPFQNKPNEDEEPDHVLARQMEDKRNPVNNVGHNMPGLNLDVAYQRKTIKGGNYSQITSELTNNQQATFAHANFMGPTVGFRVASRTESWDEAAISLSSIQYPRHNYYQMIDCEDSECKIGAFECDETCETCDGPLDTDCLTCAPGSFPEADHSCVCDISQGYSWQEGACRNSYGCTGSEYFQQGIYWCEPCFGGTIFCDDFGMNGRCNSGSIEVGGLCFCTDGYFWMDLTGWCEPAYPYCPINSDGSSGFCVGITCEETCATCSGPSDMQCTSCPHMRDQAWEDPETEGPCVCVMNASTNTTGECVCPTGMYFDEERRACLDLVCSESCGPSNCYERSDRCIDYCPHGLQWNHEEYVEIDYQTRSVGTCTCYDPHQQFNAETLTCVDLLCSPTCGDRNCFESPNRCLDGCPHGLHFEFEADVIFDTSHRIVGTCMCHDQNQYFNPDTLACEDIMCSESCGWHNCYEYSDRCLDYCPHGLMWIPEDEVTIHGITRQVGKCTCHDQSQYFNEETHACEQHLECSESCGDYNCVGRADRCFDRCPHGLKFYPEAEIEINGNLSRVGTCACHELQQLFNEEWHTCEDFECSESCGLGNCFGRPDRCFDGYCQHGLHFNHETVVEIDGDWREVGTCTCHDEHMFFNEETHACEDYWCSERCGHRNCYESPDRCFDYCPHGLLFEHEADVIFQGADRSVGSCNCHDQHQFFNEETHACEELHCDESCGERNCYQEEQKCLEWCPHGLKFYHEGDVKIHGEHRAVGTCGCEDQSQYFNEERLTCEHLECSESCAEGCFARADRCWESCNHGLKFYHELDVDIDGHVRSVGKCKCHEEHQWFNEETHVCEGVWCDESCGQGNCFEEPHRCFDACPHGLAFIWEEDVEFQGETRPVGKCTCHDQLQHFNYETHACEDRWCTESCGERNCYDRADRCFDGCPHGLQFNHEDVVDFDGAQREVGTCTCHETYQFFNEETHACEDLHCSESCGEGNCYQKPDRCFDGCPHGLHFEYEGEVIFEDAHRTVGTCMCHETHQFFNEETHHCEDLWCSETCGQGNCYQKADRCFDGCPHDGLMWNPEAEVTIHGSTRQVGTCTCHDQHQYFNEETKTCEQLHCDESCGEWNCYEKADRCFDSCPHGLRFYWEADVDIYGDHRRVGTCACHDPTQYFDEEHHSCETLECSESCGLGNCFEKPERCFDAWCPHGLEFKHEKEVEIDGQWRSVGSCTCHDEHMFFNEEAHHCEDIWCSERCGHRNCYEYSHRCLDYCAHGLHFEHEADVIFQGEHRSVGSCTCHDQHQFFNEETHACEELWCSETCGERNCYEDAELCFEWCPHGLKFYRQFDVKIHGENRSVGRCGCDDTHQYFNTERLTCEHLECSESCGPDNCFGRADRCFETCQHGLIF